MFRPTIWRASINTCEGGGRRAGGNDDGIDFTTAVPQVSRERRVIYPPGQSVPTNLKVFARRPSCGPLQRALSTPTDRYVHGFDPATRR